LTFRGAEGTMTDMLARWRLTCLCVAALLASGPARAESIRVDFAGTATDVRDSTSLPIPPPPVGERFSGWFAYDSENLLTLMNEYDEPYGLLAGSTLNLSFGGVTWSAPTIHVYNNVSYDDECGGPCDIWQLGVNDPSLRGAAVVLDDPTQTAVSGIDPFVPMSLEGWAVGRLTLTRLVFNTNVGQFEVETEFEGAIDTWEVTVPEPGGLASLVALGALAVSRGARRPGAARPGRDAPLRGRARTREPAADRR
jgi:hypothetical protein